MNPQNFFWELKRRNIYKVAIAYIVIAWILAQVAAILFPTFEAPEWVMKVFIFLLFIGFPIAMVLAWAQGLKKESSKPIDIDINPVIEKPIQFDKNPDPRSIAVLPFDDMSPNRDHAYFSEGMSEEILNLLARIPSLRVTGRTSSFAFKNQKSGIKEIGEKLHVAHVLEGSVRKAGNKIRVTAQLIKTSDGFHLWSESYNSEFDDVFRIQDEIAKKIAENLVRRLKGESLQINRMEPDNLEAYNLYLKGMYYLNKELDGLDQAQHYFEKSLELDPNYAPAYTGKGTIFWFQYLFGIRQASEVLPEIYKAYNTSISLDETPVMNFTYLFFTFSLIEFDWIRSREYLDMAIQLDSNHPEVKIAEATWFGLCNNIKQAILKWKEAINSDPYNLRYLRIYVVSLYIFREFAKAEKWCHYILTLDPDYSEAFRMLSHIYASTGELEKAIQFGKKAVTMQQGSSWSYAALSVALIKANRFEEARKILEEALTRRQKQYLHATVFVLIYAELGEMDKCFEWLEKAYQEKDLLVTFLRSPWYDSCSKDPRFDEFVARMNFPTG